jgi:hypothetical protein
MVGFAFSNRLRLLFLVIGLVVVGQLACGEKPTVADFVSTNQAPIAEAGVDQQVAVSTTVTLDGSLSSDPDAEDGAILRYHWIVGAAQGGSVELSDSTAVQPTFIATEPGDYVFGLEVSDGDLTSLLDMVKVQVVDRIVSEQFGDVSISASIDETGDVSISASIDETTGDVEIEAEIDE